MINHQRVQIHGRREGICVSVSSLAILRRFSALNKVLAFSSTALLLYLFDSVNACRSWSWVRFWRNNSSGFLFVQVFLVGFWFCWILFEFWAWGWVILFGSFNWVVWTFIGAFSFWASFNDWVQCIWFWRNWWPLSIYLSDPSFLSVNGFRCEISVGLSSAGLAWYVLLLRLFVNL